MTREEIISMAREAGFAPQDDCDITVEELERFAAIVAAAERERICSISEDDRYSRQFHTFIKTTRARGNN